MKDSKQTQDKLDFETQDKLDFDDCTDVLINQQIPEQASLEDFLDGEKEITERWQDHWQGMPDFVQEEQKPFHKVNVCFKTKEDFEAFRELTGVTMTSKTKTVWYPPFDREANSLYAWIDE